MEGGWVVAVMGVDWEEVVIGKGWVVVVMGVGQAVVEVQEGGARKCLLGHPAGFAAPLRKHHTLCLLLA